jgi:hypothetical protein
LSLSVIGLAACGYGLLGRTSNLPTDIQKIYVVPLENLTTRSQVDLLLTRAIIDELVTRRRFEIVNARDKSDAVRSGALTSFTVRPVTFDSSGRATEYEVQIRADMDFKRTEGGEVVWEQPQYFFRENYELELEDLDQYFDLEDTTIIVIGERFAETLVIDLLEGF